jgi:hypothetical protein
MTNRITQKDLQFLLERINLAAGFSKQPKYQQGFRIGCAYGGYRLEYPAQDKYRLDVCATGYVSKRELHMAMRAFLIGILEAK